MIQHPSNDGGVIAGSGDDDREEEPADVAAEWKSTGLEGTNGAAARVASERELRHQSRHADQHGDQDVEEDESGAAERPGHVGKAPDVAEPHGDADHRHDRAEAGAESFAGRSRQVSRIVSMWCAMRSIVARINAARPR